jgi:hypothetical protein
VKHLQYWSVINVIATKIQQLKQHKNNHKNKVKHGYLGKKQKKKRKKN